MKKTTAIKKGARVEQEHVRGDKFGKLKASKTRSSAARKIATDHIDEAGTRYYPELKKMEAKLKRKKSK